MKIIFLIFFFFTNIIMAEQVPASKAKAVATTDDHDKKKYTQEEFDSAVKEQMMKELDKNLARLGHGNVIDLSNELLKKENDLKGRELKLNKDQEQMELIKKDLETKIKSFQTTQNKIIGCIDIHDKEKDKRVTHMVEVVSGMKPQVAADVLSVQEADLSVRILGLLDPSKVSKIFNLMNKEISARLQKQYLDMKR